VHVDICDDSIDHVNGPLYVVEEGQGSCWAAVLLAAILFTAGVEPVYIVDFDTSSGRNVVVATEVGGELLVLDREPKKWNYYFSTVSPPYDLRVFKILLKHDTEQAYKKLSELFSNLRPHYYESQYDRQSLKRQAR